MNKFAYGVFGLAMPLFINMPAVHADSVNPGNIVTFNDGQPANAGEVNGNFDELINQINDNDARVDFIENLGLLSDTFPGDFGNPVDCDVEGADALQVAIDARRNNSDTAYIVAAGSCSGIGVRDQNVEIRTNTSLTITGNGTNSAVFVQNGILRLYGINATINVDGNGAQSSIATSVGSAISLANVAVYGGIETQVAVFEKSQLFLLSGVTIGNVAETANGIRAEQSMVGILNFSGIFLNTTVTINSTRFPLLFDDSALETFFLDSGGSILLNIPDGDEIFFADSSTAQLGPSNFTVNEVRIVDNSSVSLDGNLFNADGTYTWNAKLLLDRGSNLRLNMEEVSNDVVVNHTGNLEVGVNSNLEVFGRMEIPTSIVMGGGTGTEAAVVVGAAAIFNSATIAYDATVVRDATLIASPFTRLDNTPPTFSVDLNGLIVDIVEDPINDVSTFSSAFATCATGGTAYLSSGADGCIPPPP